MAGLKAVLRSRWWGIIARWGSQLTDLVMPSYCAGCQRAEFLICPSCQAQISSEQEKVYEVSQGAIGLPIIGCRGSFAEPELELLPVYSAARYQGLIAAVMWEFKEQQRRQLARYFAPGLSAALQQALDQKLPGIVAAEAVIVPVPSAQRSWQRRGYWPLAEMLRWVNPPAAILNCLDYGAVGTRSQKQLNKQQRLRQDQRFRLRENATEYLAGKKIILVDDVITTGATLAAAYRVLAGRGLKVVAGVVAAATPDNTETAKGNSDKCQVSSRKNKL